jgi:hypothetical protein
MRLAHARSGFTCRAHVVEEERGVDDETQLKARLRAHQTRRVPPAAALSLAADVVAEDAVQGLNGDDSSSPGRRPRAGMSRTVTAAALRLLFGEEEKRINSHGGLREGENAKMTAIVGLFIDD